MAYYFEQTFTPSSAENFSSSLWRVSHNQRTLHLIVISIRYQVKVIAAHFNRNPVVISQGLKRIEEKLGGGKGFAKTMISVEDSLVLKSNRRKLIQL